MLSINSRAKRALLAALACALAGLGVVAASGASNAKTTGESPLEVRNLSAPDSSALTQIYSTALRSAEAAGEPAPTGMETTTSTIGRAMMLADPGGNAPRGMVDPRSGDAWADTATYVVTMHGHFTLGNVPVRPGASAPTGTVLTLMIDRGSGQVAGMHLSNAGLDLHRLGSTVTAWATP